MLEVLVALALISVFDAPIDCEQCESWNRPQIPFNVYGNTWYVGTGGLGAILVVTDEGLILLDGGLPLQLGGVTLTAIATPGHTPGGTSWTWQSCENDHCLNVVYLDSLTPVSRPGYRFSDGLGEALREALERIHDIDCDIMLSTHDFSFAMHDKLAQGREAFVDAGACRELASKTSTYLDNRLNSEQP